MGKILGRYILREVVTAWLVVTGVLLIILLANQVAGVLERAAVNQYPKGVVLQLIGLGALQNLSLLVPFGLLLGVVLAFGRLYHDSEMAAALACGIRPANVYVPVGLLAVFVAAGLAWLTLGVAPDATARALSLRNAALRAGQFAPIAAGKFRAFGGANAVVYAQNVNKDGTLGNVFVERNQGPVVSVALAQRARHSVSPDGMTHTITLYDGERYEGEPGSPQFRIVHFAEHTIPVQGTGGVRCREESRGTTEPLVAGIARSQQAGGVALARSDARELHRVDTPRRAASAPQTPAGPLCAGVGWRW